jgi:hypothetical protein
MGAIGPLLLLFSLAGGYAFLQLCHFTKHRWDALEWERNLFEAALAGGGLFVAVRLVIPMFERVRGFAQIREVVRAAVPYQFAASFVAALLLALALAGLVNLLIPQGQAIRRAVTRRGGELLILLQHAARHLLPVSLTMANRKVYVGFVLAPPSPKYPYTKIVPTVTGYRDHATLNVVFDTPYWPAYEDLERRRKAGETISVDMESFAIVLPIEQICSANQFDDDTYARYFNATSITQAGGPADAAAPVSTSGRLD